MRKPANYSIILFDGYCHLCNGAVNFIIRHDGKKLFRFVALQSEAGKLLATTYNIPEVDSVVLITQGQWFAGSEAVLRIARIMGFPWNLSVIFNVIPKNISDRFYRMVARNRYRWFGKRVSCRLPDERTQQYFLNTGDL